VTTRQATQSYEKWIVGLRGTLAETEIPDKHLQTRQNHFCFSAPRFIDGPKCGPICALIKVLAVGDLYVESFGNCITGASGWSRTLISTEDRFSNFSPPGA
jgi:hypothetical protein